LASSFRGGDPRLLSALQFALERALCPFCGLEPDAEIRSFALAALCEGARCIELGLAALGVRGEPRT
jgi:hypothetical protein